MLISWIFLTSLFLQSTNAQFSDGVSISMGVDVTRVDAAAVWNQDTLTSPASVTLVRSYVVHNDSSMLIPGSPEFSEKGVEGQFVDFGDSCGMFYPSNLPSGSILGTKFIAVVRRVNSFLPNQTCNWDEKMNNIKPLASKISGVVVWDSTFAWNVTMDPLLGVPGWFLDESTGQALVDLIIRSTVGTISFVRPFINANDTARLSQPSYSGTPTCIAGELYNPKALPVLTYTSYQKAFLIALVIIMSFMALSFVWCLVRAVKRGYLFRRPQNQAVEFGLDTVHRQPKPQVLHDTDLDKLPLRSYIEVPVAAEELPRKSMDSQRSTQTMHRPHCAVCLDSFVSGDLVRQLPCRHDFHKDCVDVWLLERSSRCPICRFDCLTGEIDPEDFAAQV
jgi:hypothetical protein